MPEREVHLLLSQRAARALDEALEDTLLNVEWPEKHNQIYTAIRSDLKDQIEKKSKRKKTR